MTIERIRSALEAKPFRPFRINLADGREVVLVRSPEFVFIPPKAERAIHVFGKREADYATVDLLLVSSLEYGNGVSTRAQRG